MSQKIQPDCRVRTLGTTQILKSFSSPGLGISRDRKKGQWRKTALICSSDSQNGVSTWEMVRNAHPWASPTLLNKTLQKQGPASVINKPSE
jgi:hypothetical protein